MCNLCSQFHWIIHLLLPLRYSLTFICPVSCVPYVAGFSGLSILNYPFGVLYRLCTNVSCIKLQYQIIYFVSRHFVYNSWRHIPPPNITIAHLMQIFRCITYYLFPSNRIGSSPTEKIWYRIGHLVSLRHYWGLKNHFVWEKKTKKTLGQIKTSYLFISTPLLKNAGSSAVEGMYAYTEITHYK